MSSSSSASSASAPTSDTGLFYVEAKKLETFLSATKRLAQQTTMSNFDEATKAFVELRGTSSQTKPELKQGDAKWVVYDRVPVDRLLYRVCVLGASIPPGQVLEADKQSLCEACSDVLEATKELAPPQGPVAKRASFDDVATQVILRNFSLFAYTAERLAGDCVTLAGGKALLAKEACARRAAFDTLRSHAMVLQDSAHMFGMFMDMLSKEYENSE